MPDPRNSTALGLATTALLVAGCGRAPEVATARADTPTTPAVAKVIAVKPVRTTIRRTAEAPGQVEAEETTPIYAKLAGFVREVRVDIGSKVEAGDVLAALAVPEMEAEVEQKRATVDQAQARRTQAEAASKVARASLAGAEAKRAEVQAGIGRAEADLARWQAEYDRTHQLVRESAATGGLLDETRSKLRAAEAARDEVRAKVRTAEAAVLEAQADLEKARADVDAAGAQIEVARADARRAEALLGYATIAAPFDGTITCRRVDTGHLTTAGTEGGPLFVIVRSGQATITVDLPERDAASTEPGDKAIIRLQAIEGRTFEGKVSRTAWALDPATRTLRVEIDLPNPEGLLRPGLYAYASIVVDEHPDVLTLPASAVVREGDKACCICVASGHAVRRPIQLGLSDGTRTEVRSGLDGDEVVVKANAASLRDGQTLDVTAIEPAAGTK